MSLVACLGAAVLLLNVSAQSTAAQIGRAQAVLARSCDLVQQRFAFYATDWRGPAPSNGDPALRDSLITVLTLALARQQGIEGGVWQAGVGSLAYAYPTYPNGPKTDLPAAEAQRILSINDEAGRDERPVARQWSSDGETLLMEACPLSIPGLTGWTMTRVRVAGAVDWLGNGVGILLLLTTAVTAWLAWVLIWWSRRVGRLEAALAAAPDGDRGPIPPTGERDLDRLVRALNLSTARLAEARARSAALTARDTENRRLAALGRVAAGVAHEVRNPLATIRLRAESALAVDDPGRGRRALEVVLAQAGRLDRLCGELLTLTQRRIPDLAPVDLAALLRDCLEDWTDCARTAGVTLAVQGGEGAESAILDAGLVRRVLDNLLDNAVRHAGQGGCVTLSAVVEVGQVRLLVEDSGPGVAPALRDSLFEPFVTGRPDGTGLGLAIVRELVEAHGGHVRLAEGKAACFVVELPRTTMT